MEKAVIIVAGGSGTRMGADRPKQFLEVKGKPILAHTLERFYQYDSSMEMVLVLPKDQIKIWEAYCQKYNITIPHKITTGGESRFHSVSNGLKMIESRGVVGVHDGVRPCVSLDTLKRCFEEAEKEGAVVPVVPLVDSIREKDGETSKAVDRSKYALVQTPQTFQWEILSKAYQQSFDPLFTDDASVVEADGKKIKLIDGNRENLKVTTPEDLKWITPFL